MFIGLMMKYPYRYFNGLKSDYTTLNLFVKVLSRRYELSFDYGKLG